MSRSRVELADIELPAFGLPEAQPDIPAAEQPEPVIDAQGAAPGESP
jgi:hypothetical protein